MELATGEIVLLLLLMLGTGVVAGLLAGLLGVGGGIVIVPILFLVFDVLDFPESVAMHVAVATSLATIVPTSIASARAHRAKGNVDVDLLKRWAPWVGLGAAAGGLLASGLDGEQLKLVFGIVALLVAVNMAAPGKLVLGESLPRSGAVQGAIGGGIGLFSALMGIGGGTLSVPTLSMFSFPTHRAVGTAAAFGPRHRGAGRRRLRVGGGLGGAGPAAVLGRLREPRGRVPDLPGHHARRADRRARRARAAGGPAQARVRHVPGHHRGEDAVDGAGVTDRAGADVNAAERAVEVDGATLHVETRGDGPPLLFLGGSNQDLRVDRLAFGWTRGRRTVAFDWRGLGRTAIDAAADDAWTMTTYANDCVAVLRALGIERCDVVGYSFGAMVAQHLAARFPDVVRRLALIAAGPGGTHGSYPIERFADLPVRARARALLELQDRRVAGRWAVDGPDEGRDRCAGRPARDQGATVVGRRAGTPAGRTRRPRCGPAARAYRLPDARGRRSPRRPGAAVDRRGARRRHPGGRAARAARRSRVRRRRRRAAVARGTAVGSGARGRGVIRLKTARSGAAAPVRVGRPRAPRTRNDGTLDAARPRPPTTRELDVTAIERIVYVEDSDDEVFLTRIVFARERVAAELVHYPRFDAMERDLADGTLGGLAACLVVVDLNLKLTKGTDAVRRLRAMPAADGAVIGVCTGSEDPADRRDAIAAGADFFVGKPLDSACLERICETVPRLRFARAPDGGAVTLAVGAPSSP